MRRSSTPVRLGRATVGIASVALLGLTGCSGDAEAEAASAPTSAEASAEATEGSAAPASTGAQPEWAAPLTTPGTSIANLQAGDVTVEVFQVGVTQATETGNFVDPETNQPIIAVGDDVVFVNYVVTNTGDPIALRASLVDVQARYDDWPYLQGMDSVTDAALYEQQGVNDDALAPGTFRDPSVYELGTGQSYSFGENFRYQPGSPITFEVTVTPVDAAGDLVFDQATEGTGAGTIS